MGFDDAWRLVQRFCCDPATAKYGPYSPVVPGERPEGRTILEDRLYSFKLVEGDEFFQQNVDVQVYLGLSELGGLLWDQEILALSRISGLEHPALPQLLSGGYQEAASGGGKQGAAFVATRGADRSLTSADAARYREDRLEALRQFEHLADGLAVLHDLGLTHRNLWPEAIDQVDDGPTGQHLRFARFEMSAFISSLLSGSAARSEVARDDIRRLVLSQGAEPLAYLPPERLSFLLPLDGESIAVESEKADVYGLAAIVWEWFLEPLPADLVPQEVPTDPAEVRAVRGLLDRLIDHRRRTVRTSRLPERLRNLLESMLAPDPDGRPTATEVVNELSAGHGSLAGELGEDKPDKPYLLAFMPDEFPATAGKWGWLEYDVDTPEGFREIVALLKADLHQAEICYSPEGAAPFVRGGDTETKREAVFALSGERAVWFGALMRGFAGEGLYPDVLLIKYVARQDAHEIETKFKELLSVARRRAMPEFEPIHYRTARASLEARRKGRPSWEQLGREIRPVGGRTVQDLTYERAIDWLLEFQGVELRARRYPYKLGPYTAKGGEEVLIHWDRARDQERMFKGSALFTKYAGDPTLRPDFGDFFGRLESEENGSADIEIFEGASDFKERNATAVQAQVVRSEGRDRIIVRRKPGQPKIPASGWVRPADDVGTDSVLRRQANARWELFALKPLTSRLRQPTAIRTLPHRWQSAGAGLREGGKEAVVEMLTHQPFYAVQGPPGTGKSTVASRAIAAYLEQEKTHRILVSAQSNFTLDNLAARILKDIGARDDNGPTDRMGDVPIALRIVSRRGNPDETIRPWMRDELVVRRAKQMRAHVEQALLGGVDEQIRPVLEHWRDLLIGVDGESILPELADRLQRGANIVFATCATATPRNLGTTGAASMFDWVIVEEAAKAWPTELAIPLVRGVRWTLIGDHHQLPAHRRDEVVRFLDSCASDPNPGLAAIGADRKAYLQAFDLFANLFTPRKTGMISVDRPTSVLGTQFRMREAIAQVVSRVFYPRELQPDEEPPEDGMPPGGLATHHDETPSPLEAPHWLRRRALVWVDTSGDPRCVEQPTWHNEGEAELVNRIVAAMRPLPRPGQDGYSAEPLAVLTPYRQQVDVLNRYGDLSPYVQTVHAFQGREADIVIVSLVRNKTRGGGTTAESYGHVGRRDLVNVMLSRAHSLLVIVGDYEHYARFRNGDDIFWQHVCQAVDHYGEIRNSIDVLPLEAQ